MIDDKFWEHAKQEAWGEEIDKHFNPGDAYWSRDQVIVYVAGQIKRELLPGETGHKLDAWELLRVANEWMSITEDEIGPWRDGDFHLFGDEGNGALEGL